jgi:hypothetical protein
MWVPLIRRSDNMVCFKPAARRFSLHWMLTMGTHTVDYSKSSWKVIWARAARRTRHSQSWKAEPRRAEM